MNEVERENLEAALGHRFRQTERLERALTHSSHHMEVAGSGPDNERMEFLGDCVLGLVVSEHLMRTCPEWDSGMLSQARARLVSANSIQSAAQALNLGSYLRLGPAEEKTGGREKRNLLADAYEAVVAAIYLDGGLEAAADFVRRSLLEGAAAGGTLGGPDPKSALQEWLQGRGLRPAEYLVARETGPDHQKTFLIEVWIQGRRVAAAEASSKKEAEQAAALLALAELHQEKERS
ncbi:MAG TPA: ribonuclease III [Candidatus Acidoferrales bacterium]|jgi:ribonuclease-3|nr:ribonuclease III [Candidatus Acidoferrales bacterium]